MRGYPTLTQKQTNSAIESISSTDLYQNQSSSESRTKRGNAASGTLIGEIAEETLRSLFGSEALGSLAFTIDPLASYFKNSGVISPWNRFQRLRNNGTVPLLDSRPTSNLLSYSQFTWNPGPSGDSPPELSVESADWPDVYFPLREKTYWSTIRDTTRKTRAPGVDYGTCFTEVFTYVDKIPHGPYDLDCTYRYEYDDHFLYEGSNIPQPRNVAVVHSHESDLGPQLYPIRPLFPYLDQSNPIVTLKALMNNNVLSMIESTLPTAPVFKSFYNIAELKDIPQCISGLRSLKEILEKAVSLRLNVSSVDKLVANQYLNYQFGIKSLAQAAQGFLALPTKAAKKLNYLLKRAGKVTSSRSKRVFTYHIPGGNQDEDPSFQLGLYSPWADDNLYIVDHQEVYTDVNIELRLVVNQTIVFPPATVPKFSDKNYRKILGVQPTVKDFYDLIPFSWLVDWFTGLGDYINIVDAIFSDRQLVHYGFLTAVYTETTTHKYRVKVRDCVETVTQTSFDSSNDVRTFSKVKSTQLYHTEYIRKIYFREDLSNLDGVKSFGGGMFNLSDFQTSILGSLLAKFT